MPELPTGTVTFLFTDLEGSTRLWEEHPDAMQAALARHDEILRDAIAAHDGHVVKTTGDGVHAVFVDAVAAARAARDAQLALARETWHDVPPLLVRMGLHTGPAELRDGDYYGTAVNRAARLMSVAHGGQVVVSLTTEELLRDAAVDDFTLIPLGEHRLRDLSRPERIFQLQAPGLPSEFPPVQSLDTFAGNLPAQVTSFVGRQRASSRRSTRRSRSARLVTITGVGGVGKTRLALQVAAEVLPRYARRRVVLRARGGRGHRDDAPGGGGVARRRAAARDVARSQHPRLPASETAPPRARQLRAPPRRGRRAREQHPARVPPRGDPRHEPRGALSTGRARRRPPRR